MTSQNILGEDALAFRQTFQAALGGMSKSTFIRRQRSGDIPAPDAWVGGKQAWKISTVRATVEELVRAGDSARPEIFNSKRTGAV